MEINSRLVRTTPGRNPGMAGTAALRGLISALGNQMNAHRLTGHMPNAQSYNQNLGFDLTDDGILPRGQASPFTPEPWMIRRD